METFTKLFGTWLVFIYHCFDRIVLSGYLMGLQRPGQVVYWLQQVLGIQAITKEVLARRTNQYVAWVQSYARRRGIPLEWAETSRMRSKWRQAHSILWLTNTNLISRKCTAAFPGYQTEEGGTGSDHQLIVRVSDALDSETP